MLIMPGSYTSSINGFLDEIFVVFLIYTQVTGELLDHLSSWDALRAALPVGTVSGAPKVIFTSPLFSFTSVSLVYII